MKSSHHKLFPATFALPLLLLCISSCESKQNNETGSADQVSAQAKEIILFESNRDGNYEIYGVQPDGTGLHRLTNNTFVDLAPSLNSSGTTMCYYANPEGDYNIYTRSLDSAAKPMQITDHPAPDVLPEFSPDDNQIVFMSMRDSSSRDMFLMNADGSNVQALTDNEDYEESPSWSPNGKEIVFTRQLRDPNDSSHAANGEIHILDLAKKEERRLTNKPGYDSGARFSPDGEQIAFYGEQDGLWDIYLIETNGQNLRNLTQDSIECYSPSWSPSGDKLVYTAGSRNDYDLWVIDLKTREKTQLTDTPGRDQGPFWGLTE